MKTEENASVVTDQKFDKSCIPYPGKKLYWIISLPYLLLLVLTAIYLWKFSILVSSIYISFYIVSIIFHGYICSFSECPYKGTMCPGAFAWFPVGKISLFFHKLKVKKSDLLINLFFLVIMITLLGIITLPLYWISKLGIDYCIGYVGFIIGHFITFILIICPKCANRLYCPTAKLSNFLYKKIFNKEI